MKHTPSTQLATSLTVALSATLAAAAALYSPAAQACSASACSSLRALPANEATVPANVPALALFGGSGGMLEVQLERLGGAMPTPVPLGSVATGSTEVPLTAPLEPGAQYRLSASGPCGSAGRTMVTQTFTAGPIATVPALALAPLGTLSVSAPTRRNVPVPTADGSCSTQLDAVAVDVSVALSEAVQPWAPMLVWETSVDGRPWGPRGSLNPENRLGGVSIALGGSWTGRGSDRVYAACATPPSAASSEGVAEGSHTVRMRARLPGSPPMLETDEVRFELRCGGSSSTDGGAGTDAGAGSDGGTAPMGGGGGCSVAGGVARSAQGWPVAVLGALGALQRLARRARRRGR